MTKLAARICRDILEGGIPAPGQPSAYAGIADLPAVLEAVQAIVVENDSGDSEAMRRSYELASTLSYAREVHTMVSGRTPLWVGQPDLVDWKERQLKAVTLLKEAATELDGPAEFSYSEITVGRPKPGDESALLEYLRRNACGILNDVTKLAERSLLGQMLRAIAASIEAVEPEMLTTLLERRMGELTPSSIDAQMAGKRGRAKASQASSNRGALIRALGN